MEGEWSEIDVDDRYVQKGWEHEEGHEVTVEFFDEDATWDTKLNDDLVSNRDTQQEAIERALELMFNGFEDYLD